jgi:hypothetical protein
MNELEQELRKKLVHHLASSTSLPTAIAVANLSFTQIHPGIQVEKITEGSFAWVKTYKAGDLNLVVTNLYYSELDGFRPFSTSDCTVSVTGSPQK